MQVVTAVHILLALLWVAIVFFVLALQQILLNKGYARFAWVLPAINFAISVALSIPNFITAWRVYLSLPAFAAAVVIFVFFNLTTIVLILIYLDWWRDKQKKRKKQNPRQIRQKKSLSTIKPKGKKVLKHKKR